MFRPALYLALTLTANAARAEVAPDLLTGDMAKLTFVDPIAAPDIAFLDETGAETTLAAFQGQWVVLNFWATWCAPCREEMPTLSALQTALNSDTFEVVTIATGRNDPMEMADFMGQIGVDNLALHTDPRQALARAMGVLGLPVTIILNPDGTEVARLIGDADWNSAETHAVLSALMSAP
jgi:thiol-disulfide isomerase/thioredoxin